jgi:hypothetical protein
MPPSGSVVRSIARGGLASASRHVQKPLSQGGDRLFSKLAQKQQEKSVI